MLLEVVPGDLWGNGSSKRKRKRGKMRPLRGSWLSLVSLCTVSVLSIALGLGVLFAGAAVVLAAVQPSSASNEVQVTSSKNDSPAQESPAKQEDQANPAKSSRVFSGMITDSRCGARHSMKSGKSSADCTRSCVRNGSQYVLVDGEEIHALDGNQLEFEKLAGVRVEVTGSLEGNAIKVESITAR
jgi:hypothetical protein